MRGREKFLPFSPPLIEQEEINEMVDTLRSDWITTGPKTARFETEFAESLNAPAALALNSCTAGLHLALVALGIGPGDEVVTTPMTFAASVNVIEHVGAHPVLADVEPDTLNLSPAAAEAAITPRTKAILPVHYAGHPADLDPLIELVAAHDLALIEDAAHAPLAKYRGRFVGSRDNPAAFSFYATKNMTTAEGGMLTGNPPLIDQARILSMHGMSRDAWKRYDQTGSWYYEIVQPGFKYNMTDIQAALGLWQLRKLHRFQERRKEVVLAYNSAFDGEEALQVPVQRPEVEHAWHLYVLRLRTEALRIDRAGFIEALRERNISASVHFIPIHLHPYYRNKYSYRPEDFRVALEAYERMVSLPLNPRLSERDVVDVIEAVLDITTHYRR